MICPECKNNNPEGFDYCLKCGKVLIVVDPNKNATIPNEEVKIIRSFSEPTPSNNTVQVPAPVTNAPINNSKEEIKVPSLYNPQNLSNAEIASQEGSGEIKNNYQAPSQDAFQSKVQTVMAPSSPVENKGGKKNWVTIIVVVILLLVFAALGAFILFSSK